MAFSAHSSKNKRSKHYVWDIPVRLCHWAMVILLIAAYLTAEVLNDEIELHAKFGYMLMGVVIFRIAWGVCGTHYAKFHQFLYRPCSVWRYSKTILDKNSAAYTGHNPLGGWMVVIMLLVLLLQGISGLFMSDEILFYAPYYDTASSTMQVIMANIHLYNFMIIKIIVALHITAVMFYVGYKKQALVCAMFTGNKTKLNPKEERPMQAPYWLKCLTLALLTAVLIYLVVVVWAPEPEDLFWY